MGRAVKHLLLVAFCFFLKGKWALPLLCWEWGKWLWSWRHFLFILVSQRMDVEVCLHTYLVLGGCADWFELKSQQADMLFSRNQKSRDILCLWWDSYSVSVSIALNWCFEKVHNSLLNSDFQSRHWSQKQSLGNFDSNTKTSIAEGRAILIKKQRKEWVTNCHFGGLQWQVPSLFNKDSPGFLIPTCDKLQYLFRIWVTSC